MNTVLTAKRTLHTTPEQFHAWRATQLASGNALHSVSRYAFAHGKMSHTVGLQDGTYQDIRCRFGLPAQLACSVPRQVGATEQALWTKGGANATARRRGCCSAVRCARWSCMRTWWGRGMSPCERCSLARLGARGRRVSTP